MYYLITYLHIEEHYPMYHGNYAYAITKDPYRWLMDKQDNTGMYFILNTLVLTEEEADNCKAKGLKGM